jgi:hypothetical protein
MCLYVAPTEILDHHHVPQTLREAGLENHTAEPSAHWRSNGFGTILVKTSSHLKIAPQPMEFLSELQFFLN